MPKSLPALSLTDGKATELALHSGPTKKGTVLVFISAECPCSESHEPRLQAISEKFPQFNFVGVVSGETPDDVRAHFAKAPIKFPVLLDKGSTIADKFDALKTPHVFVLNAAGEVVYRGAVDNSHNASDAKKMYLEPALDAMVAGITPTPSETKPLGCRISH